MKKIYASLLLMCGQLYCSQTGTQIERLHTVYDTPKPGDMSETQVAYLPKLKADQHMKDRDQSTLVMSYENLRERSSSYAARKAEESTQYIQSINNQVKQLQSELDSRNQQMNQFRDPQFVASWANHFITMPSDIYTQNAHNYSPALQSNLNDLWLLRKDIEYVDGFISWRASQGLPCSEKLEKSNYLKSRFQAVQDNIVQIVHNDFEIKVRENLPEMDRLHNLVEQNNIHFQIQSERLHRYNYLSWYYGLEHVDEMAKNSVIRDVVDQVMDDAWKIASLNKVKSENVAKKIQALAHRISQLKSRQNQSAALIQSYVRANIAKSRVAGIRLDKKSQELVSQDVMNEVINEMLKVVASDEIRLRSAAKTIQPLIRGFLARSKMNEDQVVVALQGQHDLGQPTENTIVAVSNNAFDDEEPVIDNESGKKTRKRKNKKKKKPAKQVISIQPTSEGSSNGVSSNSHVEPAVVASVHDLIPTDPNKLNTGVIDDVMRFKRDANLGRIRQEHLDWSEEKIQKKQQGFIELQQNVLDNSVREYFWINTFIQKYSSLTENVMPANIQKTLSDLTAFYQEVKKCTGVIKLKTRVDNAAPSQHGKMIKNLELWIHSVKGYEGKTNEVGEELKKARETLKLAKDKMNKCKEAGDEEAYKQEMKQCLTLKKAFLPLEDLHARFVIVTMLQDLHAVGGPLDFSFIEKSEKEKYANLLQQQESKMSHDAMIEIVSGAVQVFALANSTNEDKMQLLLPYVQRAFGELLIPLEVRDGMAQDCIRFVLRQLNFCELKSVNGTGLALWLQEQELLWMHSATLDNLYHGDVYTNEQIVAMVKMRSRLVELLIN